MNNEELYTELVNKFNGLKAKEKPEFLLGLILDTNRRIDGLHAAVTQAFTDVGSQFQQLYDHFNQVTPEQEAEASRLILP